MALVKPFVFQIVGFQNSGKTTVVSQLIRDLNNNGMKVAAIKHHGHGGKPQSTVNKDSSKYVESGAAVSIVEGDGGLILEADQTTWRLADQIQLAAFLSPDIILIEGHKKESYPKLVLVKEEKELDRLPITDQVVAVFVWNEVLLGQLQDRYLIPCFQLNDPEGMAWIMKYLQDQLDSN